MYLGTSAQIIMAASAPPNSQAYALSSRSVHGIISPMKSTCKRLSTSVEFSVEFDKNDFEPARLKALERLARNIKVPGFRNGKAPANVVEQHVDPNELSNMMLDILVRRAIPKVFADEKVNPISIPHVEVIKYVPGDSPRNIQAPFDYIFSEASEFEEDRSELQVITFKDHPLWEKKVDKIIEIYNQILVK